MDNVQFIRQAALDLYSLDSKQVVKTATVYKNFYKRVVNWYKGLGDPEFQGKLEKLQRMSPDVKRLIDTLSIEMDKFNKSLENIDPEQFGKSMEAIRPLVAELSGELSDLDLAAAEAIAEAPTKGVIDQDGKMYTEDEFISHIPTKDKDDYRKDNDKMKLVRNQLPENLDIEPSRNIRKPMQSFEWIKQFDPSSIRTSKNAESWIIEDSFKPALFNAGLLTYEVEQTIEKNMSAILNELNKGILNGILVSYSFPKSGPVNKMNMVVTVPPFEIPGTGIIMSNITALLDDKAAMSLYSQQELELNSVKGVRANQPVQSPEENAQPLPLSTEEVGSNPEEQVDGNLEPLDLDAIKSSFKSRMDEIKKIGRIIPPTAPVFESVASIKGLEKKSPEFISELISVGNRLGIDPSFLASTMLSESAFDHTAINPKGGATGLIQFMPACVSIDTEILTADGWMFYNQVSVGDDILSFNPDKNSIEIDKIKELYVFNSNTAYRMHNKQFDFISTHDHRWYCDYNGKIVVKTTEELSNLNSKYKIIRGAPIDSFKSLSLSDDFFELLGCIIGDGSIDKGHFSKERRSGITIYQSLRSKPQVVDRIQKCLNSVFGEGKYCYSDHQDGMARWFIRSKDALMFYKFLDKEKVINKRLLFNLSSSQLSALKAGYLITDGTMQYGKCENFVQCHEGRMRDFQLICFLLGETANVKEYIRKESVQKFPSGHECIIKPIKYYCNVKEMASLTEAGKCKMNYDKVQGRVKVWCPQTGNKTWIARRNGYITITGNTAKKLGTTTEALAAMSDVQQLAYVEKFFKPWAGRIKSPGDLYMATFLPIFVGKPPNHVIGQKDNHEVIAGKLTYHKVWEYNKVFDSNKDGKIVVSDVTGRASRYYKAGMSRGMLTPQSVNQSNPIVAGKGSEMENQNKKDQFGGQDAQDLFKFLYAAGPIEKIVRRSICKKVLPNTRVLISVGSPDVAFHNRIRFAKVLASALRIELDGESSIHNYNDNIEIECDIAGSEKNVLMAAKGLCDGVSNAFELATEKCGVHKVNTRVFPGIKSSYALVDSGTMETCFRKFAFEQVGK